MKKKVVFIASCSHSGSTVLEMALSGNRRHIAIGEAFQLIDPRNRIISNLKGFLCGCGDLITNCLFWSQIIKELKMLTKENTISNYSRVFDIFSENSGCDIIIDSSKTPAALKVLASINEIDLHVIHLIRDFRPWLISMIDKDNREMSRKQIVNNKPFYYRYANNIKKNRIYYSNHWYTTNKKIEKFILNNKIKVTSITYDSFALNPKESIIYLSKEIGFEYSSDMLELKKRNYHSILSNRMRFCEEDKRQIKYDYRWFHRNEWLLPFLISKSIRKYNKSKNILSTNIIK